MEKSMVLGGSEQASSSDDEQLLVATIRKMMQKEVESMVIHTLHKVMPKEVEMMVIRAVRQEIGLTLEGLIRKVMKEAIESALAKFSGGNQSNANDAAMSKERELHLKFLDEVSPPVPTGKLIKGKGGTYIRVALVDKMSGEVVKCGPESSGKVEILLLDDNEHNWSLEDFNNRIIKEGDKTKPHFAKRIYVDLVDGIGIVDNAKLGQDSKWTKKFECCLGARMESFNGFKVQQAWTPSFVVSDSRGERQRKSDGSPRLSDSVCKLKNIGKATGQHLNDNNITTVKDFLFMQSINPQKLQEIVSKGAKWEAASSASSKWKATVDHAHTCIVDDKSVLYYESSEMGIAFNVIGGLKGIIQQEHALFIPYDKLSDEQKSSACELLLSASENREDIKSFEEEDALVHQLSLRPRIVWDECLSQDDLFRELDNRAETRGATSNLNIPDEDNNISFDDSGDLFHEHDNHAKTCGDNSTLYFPDEDNNIMNNIKHNESYPHQQSNGVAIRFGGATTVMLWTLRVRKKRSMASGGTHVQKKQRID